MPLNFVFYWNGVCAREWSLTLLRRSTSVALVYFIAARTQTHQFVEYLFFLLENIEWFASSTLLHLLHTHTSVKKNHQHRHHQDLN